MTITGRAGLVFIELAVEEASRIYIGHRDLILPIGDSDATEEQLQDAIAEAGAASSGEREAE